MRTRTSLETLALWSFAVLGWALVAISPLAGELPLPRRVAHHLLVLAAGTAIASWFVLRSLRRRKRRIGGALLLLVVSFLYYESNGRALTSADNIPARELATRILSGRGLQYAEYAASGDLPYYLTADASGVHSAFPLGTGMLTLPFGATARLVHPSLLEPARLAVFEKLLAAWLSSLAVAFFFLTLAGRYGSRDAILPTLVFAFATPMATCQSQGLWSATGATLTIVVMLRSALRRGAETHLALRVFSGTCALVLCRPSDVAASLCTLARNASRRTRAFLVGAIAFGTGAALAINLELLGGPFGGYGRLNLTEVGFDLARIPAGLAGVLVSPSRGLLVFAPWLLATLPIFARDRRLPHRVRWATLLGVIATIFVCSAYGKWWGGYSFGPRLLASMSPLLALTVVSVRSRGSRARRKWHSIVLALASLAAMIQFFGAQRSAAWAWSAVADPDRAPEILWDVRNGQLAATLLPNWRFVPTPYGPNSPPPPRGNPGLWTRIDLRPYANARYDEGKLFPWQGLTEWAGAFPRLRPEVMNRPDAIFHFLPVGEPNAVVLCRPESGVEFFLEPALRVRSIQLAVTVASPHPTARAAPVARLRIRPSRTDFEVTHTLRFGEELLSYSPEDRDRWPAARFVYAAEPNQRDALFRLRLPSRIDRNEVASVAFEIAAYDSGARCVALLAMTVESK